MAKEARSKGACWTCRLRRKKCDEAAPSCLACTSHSIPCHGYGKPDWADGGSLQKAKAEELRAMIREVASSRRRLGKHQISKTLIDQKQSEPAAERPDLRDQSQPASIVDKSIALQRQLTSPFTEIRNILCTTSLCPNSTFAPQDDDYQEILLMHYIDVVFPIHFPLSTPMGDTRDWLLPLMLQVKPLYHTAISLAAHHQELLTPGTDTGGSGVLHHTLAIKELRQYLAQCHGFDLMASLESNVEVLASIVLLISLEVFLGDTQSWYIHLQAPSLLLAGLQTACKDEHRQILPLTHRKGLHFFVTVAAWYTALSIASTNLKPWVPPSCLSVKSGLVIMKSVMGCHNDVGVCLLELARLKERQIRSRNAGQVGLERVDLIIAAKKTENELRKWLQPISKEDHIGGASLDPAQSITNIFANAALVYLCVILSETVQDLPKICDGVCGSLVALENLPDQRLLGILAWPLCITGCMATGWQRDVINKIFLGASEVSIMHARSLNRCRSIIEECWRLRAKDREGGPQTTWVEAMSSLGLNILLA